MKFSSNIYFLFACFEFIALLGQSQDLTFPRVRASSNCKTSTGESGVCRNIFECPRIISRLHEVQPVHCGWVQGVPKVCCPGAQLKSDETCANVVRKTAENGTLNNPLVVGGRISTNNRPWMAAIATFADDPDVPAIDRLLCGGTLIGEQHILTAAHCFARSRSPRDYEVYMGNVWLNVTSDTAFQVSNVIIHQDFKPGFLYSDIAIVKLKEAVRFNENLMPACLASPSLDDADFDGGEILVIGWGTTQYLSKVSIALREAELPVIPINDCNETIWKLSQFRLVFPSGISTSLLCAGHSSGEKDACQGDSGGPLMWKDPSTKRWNVIGIVSAGLRCALPGIPGIYTRVSSYRSWIVENAV